MQIKHSTAFLRKGVTVNTVVNMCLSHSLYYIDYEIVVPRKSDVHTIGQNGRSIWWRTTTEETDETRHLQTKWDCCSLSRGFNSALPLLFPKIYLSAQTVLLDAVQATKRCLLTGQTTLDVVFWPSLAAALTISRPLKIPMEKVVRSAKTPSTGVAQMEQHRLRNISIACREFDVSFKIFFMRNKSRRLIIKCKFRVILTTRNRYVLKRVPKIKAVGAILVHTGVAPMEWLRPVVQIIRDVIVTRFLTVVVKMVKRWPPVQIWKAAIATAPMVAVRTESLQRCIPRRIQTVVMKCRLFL